jgi:hypothetical protein
VGVVGADMKVRSKLHHGHVLMSTYVFESLLHTLLPCIQGPALTHIPSCYNVTVRALRASQIEPNSPLSGPVRRNSFTQVPVRFFRSSIKQELMGVPGRASTNIACRCVCARRRAWSCASGFPYAGSRCYLASLYARRAHHSSPPPLSPTPHSDTVVAVLHALPANGLLRYHLHLRLRPDFRPGSSARARLPAQLARRARRRAR